MDIDSCSNGLNLGSSKDSPLIAKQLSEYRPDGIEYCNSSLLIKKYVQQKGAAFENSIATYRGKFWRFAYFVFSGYQKKPLDDFIKQIKTDGKPDPYDFLTEFAAYLKARGAKPNELRQKVKRAYKFLRYCGTDINQEDFCDRVTLPRQEFLDFEGAEKTQIVELL